VEGLDALTHATLGRTSRWRSLLASRPTGSTVRRVPPAPCRQVSARPGPVASWQSASPCRIDVAIVDLAGQSVRDPGDVLGSHPRGMKRTGGHRVYRDDQQRPSREGPALEGLFRILSGSPLGRFVPADVVTDLRRATNVQHHRRTEPSATNPAKTRSPQYQRNLAVTSAANDDWETFTRQGSLVRSQYRPPRILIYSWVSSRPPERRVRYASELAAPTSVLSTKPGP
jgi:hypothetical protein